MSRFRSNQRLSAANFGSLTGAFAIALSLSIGAPLTGCRTSTKDVHRWANTSQGPKKLIAVVTHDKFPIDLRVEAAMTLVEMKPRGGRRIGIQGTDEHPGLIDALAQLPPTARAQLISRLVPKLVQGMLAPPPGAGTSEGAPPDPSFAHKDAAFALLTHESGSLLMRPEHRRALQNALIHWSMTNFAAKMDESSQMFGMEQVLRELKADGVRQLPDLLQPGAAKIDRISDLVADLGDQDTKLRASKRLVEIARGVNSEAWIKQKEPVVAEANRASKLNPTKEQFDKQLRQFQEEELLRIFASMKRVGGSPVVGYLLSYAADKHHPAKRRAAALAALEGNINPEDAQHAQALLALAQDEETPDEVRDVALRRVGEMPRSRVVDELYGLFKSPNWKVRWVAAELILKMSSTHHMEEFLAKLRDAEGMALTEPLRYGALIGGMKGSPKPEILLSRYLGKGPPVQARLTALGYYYEHGKPGDLAKVEPYLQDTTSVPRCREDAKDCEWQCSVDEQPKEISTVGDFVQYCVRPAMEKRTEADTRKAKN